MSIVAILLLLVGGLVYLYFYWNRLKEDYTSHQIFTAAFYSLIGALALYLVGRFFIFQYISNLGIQSSGFLFWFSFLGAILGYVIALWRFKFRFFESLEALVTALLFLILFVFISDTFMSSSLFSLGGATLISLLLVLFYFLETKYKNFNWYKSGKVGFSGLTVVGIFFMLRAVVALVFPFVVSFLGKIEVIPSAIVSFLMFLLIYNLSSK